MSLASPLRAADLVFLGDSLTAGYGLGKDRAYPALIAAELAREGFDFRVVNAGVSGDTTGDGLRRVGKAVGPDTAILIVALGANDGLRRLPVPTIERNLLGIIAAARDRAPRVRILLTGMRMFEQLGPAYVREFAQVFPRVARQAKVELMPYLLEGVGLNAALNQPDGLHPTAEGQQVMAREVWKSLRPLLGKPASPR